jgi:L-ascorbate metabolism protein UlaG (beta-lactamase superfamily)
MKITYYGHSCFAVQCGKFNLLFDPFISPNPKAKDIDLSTIKANYILISHAHGDHIADAVTLAHQNNATLIAAYEITEYFTNKGITKNHPMNTGAYISFPFGKLRTVVAQHSSTFPDGTPGGNPMGFVIEAEKTFYYAGDTALTLDMELIARKHQVDFAFLPIGNNFTMDYFDACDAADMVKTNQVVGMHFDTFPYIEINHSEAETYFANRNKTLKLPAIGESFDIYL